MTFEELVGKNVKRLRLAAGVRQEDVAAAAKRHALGWGRSSVANLELGQARPSAVEFVLLPSILHMATGRDVAIGDLLATDEDEVTLTDDGVNSVEARPAELLAYVKGGTKALSRSGVTLAELLMVSDLMDEATHKAARRLGVTSERAAEVARQAWGRRLSDVRDERAAERTPEGATARSVQAIRGQVTRELVAELAALIEKGKG